MDYIYTIIYRFEGISGSSLHEDKIVYQNDAHDITVLLTNDINHHCLQLDVGQACASFLLRGMFGGKKLQDLPIAIDAEVTKIQDERASKKKTGAYAVIIIKGYTELNINPQLHRETDQFRICFDAIDKDLLRKLHKVKIHSIVSSLSFSTSPEYHAERESSGIHFIDEKGKPLYTFTMQGGRGRTRLILSKPIDIEKENEITQLIGLSTNNPQFKTPFRLFTQSLETTQDELRSFISAWSALEIFTNKVFPSYEEKFIANIVDDHNSHGVNQFLMRIQEVMKDKYRLTDKFSLIASFLSDEIEKDIKYSGPRNPDISLSYALSQIRDRK